MQYIPQDTLNETTKIEQDARVDLWEIDLTTVGGKRYFFCNEVNEKGEPVTWQGRQFTPYPIEGQGLEMNGKGVSARFSLKVSNLFGLVTEMSEDLQSLVGGSVVRHRVYRCFLDAVNFTTGNPQANPEQEAVARYQIEQLSELTNKDATFTLASPTETDGAIFPGRIMLADTCTWGYRDENCGFTGGPVADEFDNPTTDPAKDKCSHCLRGCEMRNNLINAGFFASINKLSS